jgi:hypothetical protein
MLGKSVICAKALGKRAAMIERHYMGGDCLNVGCFPSKAVIRCARAVHDVMNSARFGVKLPPGEVHIYIYIFYILPFCWVLLLLVFHYCVNICNASI